MDIVERLEARDLLMQDEEFVLVPLCREAASEITRLREENKLLREAAAHVIDECRKMRKGTDDWFDLVEIEAVLCRAALATTGGE